MRAVLVAFCTRLLHIFFRRIEIVGEHHVPQSGAVVFAANHPNGLLDPLLLLCAAGRRVSFLAKEPLFRTPVVGYFVRSFESLPVYRSQDGADPARNRAMQKAAVRLLERGNALGLFPEGVSHSSPQLMRFKSGAARMALAARALGRGEVHLVPVFLYYEQKQTFRSRAVLAYGPALEVPLVSLDEAGEAPPALVNELTARLREAIAAIAPTAASVDALVLAEQTERLIEVVEQRRGETGPSLADRMQERRRLLDLYPILQARYPEQVAALLERLTQLSRAFELHGLPLDAPHEASRRAPGAQAWQLFVFTSLALPGALGIVLHAPAYHLIRYLAVRYSGQETDVQATAKLLGGLLLFPATWLLAAGAGAVWGGAFGFALTALLAALSGWAALGLLETISWLSRRHGRRGRRVGTDFLALDEERQRLASDVQSLLALAPQAHGTTLPPNQGL